MRKCLKMGQIETRKASRRIVGWDGKWRRKRTKQFLWIVIITYASLGGGKSCLFYMRTDSEKKTLGLFTGLLAESVNLFKR